MIQLLKYLKEYKKDAVLTPVWVLLETVGELFLTITIGHFIDEIANPNTAMDIILSYGLRLFFLAVACLIFGGISGWTSTKAAAGLSKNLRNEMFSRIQDFFLYQHRQILHQQPGHPYDHRRDECAERSHDNPYVFDDAVHGLCDDHDVPRICQPYPRDLKRAVRHRQSGKPG